MSRRLPVYLLLDTSGSMAGVPIQAVENGVQMLVSALRQDPQALETACLSVITFDATAKQMVPLTDLGAFQLPPLTASAATAMGEALSLVAECRDREVRKATPQVRGDWKPLVFLMTDGEPTDDLQKGIDEFKKRTWGAVVACAAGPNADPSRLKDLTETVVRLETADPGTLRAFFKWVTASISTVSASVGNGQAPANAQLPPPPAEVILAV